MKVLIGCEFSGTVRRAFRALGHDAWSCDLLPAEDNSSFHIQADVLSILNGGWDLAIFHPPCTFLCNSGVRWLYGGKGRKIDLKRWQEMEQGALFFKALLNAPIPRIAIENPIMHGHAKRIIQMPHTQLIQPYMFGHGEKKATCLWLIGLPALKPTQYAKERVQRIHLLPPGEDRWKERSKTYEGIALAMASQWSNVGDMKLKQLELLAA